MYIADSAGADQITSGEWESIGYPAAEAGATVGSGTIDTTGTVNAGEYAKFTDSNTVEARTAAEVLSDLGIEASADVTDTTNVTAAGALMDSEVTNLSLVKGLTSGISNGNVLVANANVADNDFLKVDGTSIEGRTAAEVRSDLGIADNEIIDWTASSAGTIHASNYTDTNTQNTYTYS